MKERSNVNVLSSPGPILSIGEVHKKVETGSSFTYISSL
jgi:hypothetical protein